MSTTRTVEHRITRDLLNRQGNAIPGGAAQRLIYGTAIAVGMAVLAAFVPGLIWILLLGATVVALGS